MSDPPKLSEKLQETADKLLATAERCYRLARGITDRRAIAALVDLARECEERAEAIRPEPD